MAASKQTAQTAYTITDCGFSYKGHPCLHGINISLAEGRFYGLVGPNGSGKTTLVNLLTGTARPTSGTIELYQSNVYDYAKTDLARILSLVPQSFAMEFEYTVFEVVMMGRHPYIDRFGSPSEEDVKQVSTALQTLDIQHLQDRYVTRLSGGERQRVLVARALAQNTRVMILDEATASLDVRHSIDIMKALRQRVDTEDVTVVAAIHDLDLAAAFCDELIVMQHGTIHSHGHIQTILTTELLRNIFAVEADIIHPAHGTPHIQYRYSHA
jgi:iron complex transport system ATP-binding protein